MTKTEKTDWRTRLAKRALANVYFGGASALVIAKRMHKMNLPNTDTASDIVNYVYHHDNIKPYELTECKNCGCEFLPIDTTCENDSFCDNSCAYSYYGISDPDDLTEEE